ncbi:MAG: 4-alpha-glucanotransferase [Treponema sp.]|jgi:4-alpha-glucanotransferase|nr:4-alpha-glucanotransferase [Treponema sp.]
MAQKNDISKTSSRLIGAVVPLGALKTEKSIGVGEFPDLADFGALCAKMHIGLVQLLPVNDTGYQSSPYSALTAFALNPLYLRIGDLSEAVGSQKAIHAIKKEFDSFARFPYGALLGAKMNLLRDIYRENSRKIAGDDSLSSWINENSWVKQYAVFRRLKETNGEKSWLEWSEYRNPQAAEIAELWDNPSFKEDHLFWAWIQKALDRQFSAAAASLEAQGIILKGDLPILMNDDSCDVWANPEIFDMGFSAGAPPDMYSPEGQNWGFPIYNWKAQEKDDYAWWKARLKAAEKYYHAYRIDHVLGFFRIWASKRDEYSAVLGRYISSLPVTAGGFQELGFDEGRIRWISESHVLTGEVWDALREDWGGHFSEDDVAAAANRVFDMALDRIEGEEMWLFKNHIKSEKDINALDIHHAAKAFLVKAWGNRIFIEQEKGEFFPVWYYRFSRAYASLSEDERGNLEALLNRNGIESEKMWEAEGEKLLSMLTSSSSMLACAEDLGAVPDCVPIVLEKLGILGLRVVRWHREWEKNGQPYVHFGDYPENSVCTPAVHDSSCLREWWDREADQKQFSTFIGVPSMPKVYNPGVARTILSKVASAASRFRVFQIQDLMHLSTHWYAADPAAERVNVPGTVNDFNWTYRLPATIDEIMQDEELVRAVQELAAVEPAEKKAKK